MQKLSYFMLNKSIPSVWQKCHVLEITNYLYQRGYYFGFLICPNSNKYLITIDDYSIFFKNSKDICEWLIDLYFSEKEEEEREYLLKRNERERKNKLLKERVYKYETIYFKKD